VADEGVGKAKFKNGFNEIEGRVWEPTHFAFWLGVRGAHTAWFVVLFLTYLPLCAAEKNRNHAEG